MDAVVVLSTTLTAVETPMPAPPVDPAMLPATDQMTDESAASTSTLPPACRPSVFLPEMVAAVSFRIVLTVTATAGPT